MAAFTSGGGTGFDVLRTTNSCSTLPALLTLKVTAPLATAAGSAWAQVDCSRLPDGLQPELAEADLSSGARANELVEALPSGGQLRAARQRAIGFDFDPSRAIKLGTRPLSDAVDEFERELILRRDPPGRPGAAGST